MGCGIKVITANATDEALGLWVVKDRVEAQSTLQGPIIPLGHPPDKTYLHIFLHLFLLVSELTKSINDQTWKAGRKSVPNL